MFEKINPRKKFETSFFPEKILENHNKILEKIKSIVFKTLTESPIPVFSSKEVMANYLNTAFDKVKPLVTTKKLYEDTWELIASIQFKIFQDSIQPLKQRFYPKKERNSRTLAEARQCFPNNDLICQPNPTETSYTGHELSQITTEKLAQIVEETIKILTRLETRTSPATISKKLIKKNLIPNELLFEDILILLFHHDIYKVDEHFQNNILQLKRILSYNLRRNLWIKVLESPVTSRAKEVFANTILNESSIVSVHELADKFTKNLSAYNHSDIPYCFHLINIKEFLNDTIKNPPSLDYFEDEASRSKFLIKLHSIKTTPRKSHPLSNEEFLAIVEARAEAENFKHFYALICRKFKKLNANPLRITKTNFRREKFFSIVDGEKKVKGLSLELLNQLKNKIK